MKAAEPPSLTLEITKGPREGDTLTYHPTTDPIVRIGRLVRGNTVAIKDVGISSKHLTIHFHPDSYNWILTDLDSSNGTFVNGFAVGMEPGKGYVVGDGDTVKIGNWTDFVCRVRGGGRGGTGFGLRKNPRRRGNLGEEKDGVRVLEDIGNGNGGGEEGGVLEEKCPVVRRRGPRKDGGVSKEAGVGCQREAKGKENSAVARVADSREVGRSKEEVNLVESERKQSQDCRVVAVEESKRRGGRKDEVSKGIVVKRVPLEDPVEIERVVQVVDNVVVAARVSTRRTRGWPKKEDQLLDKVLENERKQSQDCRVVAVKESKKRGGREDEVSKGIVVKRVPLEDPVEIERVVQVVENVAVASRASTRRTRGRPKKEDQLLDKVLEHERKQSQDCRVVAVEESKRRGGREDEVSNGIVVKREPLEDPVEIERVVQVVENVNVAAHASTRRTRGRPKKEDQLLDKVLENGGLACGDNRVVSMKTRTGLRGRRKNVRAAEELKRLDVIEELVDGASENKENKDISNSIRGGIVERARDLPDGNQDSGNFDKEKECVDPPGIQKGSAGCDDTNDVRNEIGSEAKSDAMRNEQMPDLSKITVREWLDWLEANLPKQIIAETEKLIEEMRSKALRVKEYKAEQMMKREVK